MSDPQIAKVVQDVVDAMSRILSLCGIPVQIGHAIVCIVLQPFNDADATRFRNIGSLGFAALLALISTFLICKAVFQCRRYKTHYRATSKIPTLGSLAHRLYTPMGSCIVPVVGMCVGYVGDKLLQDLNTTEMQQVAAVLAGMVGYSACQIVAVSAVYMVKNCTAKAKKAMGIQTIKSHPKRKHE